MAPPLAVLDTGLLRSACLCMTLNRLSGTLTLWDTRLLQVDPMDGISLIGLPLLELEELDVLGLVELATEDEDLFCPETEPLIW